MSHWTDVKTQIRDLAALSAAVAELTSGQARLWTAETAKAGYPTLIAASDQTKAIARGWRGRTITCDAVIVMPGSYDVALTRQPDGTYTTQADYYDGSIEAKFGAGCAKLVKHYGAHKTELEMRKLGMKNIRRQNLPNGKIAVLATPGRSY